MENIQFLVVICVLVRLLRQVKKLSLWINDTCKANGYLAAGKNLNPWWHERYVKEYCLVHARRIFAAIWA